ncbi:hypothetical protein LB542_28635, partial [Mesorhizobium sp. BR1-1-9]|uniref:hypothetical protein n=1 Tax=Mesorhizobium sp. BR1-1-9 TaxID=2876646 RepID=UPI001CD11BD2
RKVDKAAKLPISPLAGQMAGRPEGVFHAGVWQSLVPRRIEKGAGAPLFGSLGIANHPFTSASNSSV